jgi:hypothetical protein
MLDDRRYKRTYNKITLKLLLTGLSRKRFEDSKAEDVTLLIHVYEYINVNEIIEYRIAPSELSS